MSGLGRRPALGIPVILVISAFDLQLKNLSHRSLFMTCSSLEEGCHHLHFPCGKTEAGEAQRQAAGHPAPRTGPGLVQSVWFPRKQRRKRYCSFGASWEKRTHLPCSSFPGVQRETTWTLLGPQATFSLSEGTHRKSRWGRGREGPGHIPVVAWPREGSDGPQGPFAKWTVVWCPGRAASVKSPGGTSLVVQWLGLFFFFLRRRQ